MVTCFERIVDNDQGTHRIVMHKEYDLDHWCDDFNDIIAKIGADCDGDVIMINNERYYVNCMHKIISHC